MHFFVMLEEGLLLEEEVHFVVVLEEEIHFVVTQVQANYYNAHSENLLQKSEPNSDYEQDLLLN